MSTELQPNSDPIEADDDLSDSAYDGDSRASSTQSLTESIMEHVYENGRRYHAKSVGRYHQPSDETEQDRLDLTHHIFLELLGGKISIAPFDQDPNYVLDCGTGTGIWALDYGDLHPASTVVGVDLAPIQPNYVYPNVRFELDDLELQWTFKYKFDLIHSRHMIAGIKDWPRYFEQMYEAANPGAYVEIVEHDMNGYRCDDGTMPEDTIFNRWIKLTTGAMEKAGLSPLLTKDDYTRMIKDAGFEIVEALEFRLPCGGWPKRKRERYLGLCWAEQAKTGFESYSKSLLVNGAGLSAEETDEILEECIKGVAAQKEHIYVLTWHILARKPL
ncbi:S-adenosyl-L-methionine-dependent methyltransferase [Ascodesmis nigricans]|uniref:S-adenosyl-L-methionine-dependent methyltransferase n=1 Tax=Ascodesmis nigricans TaxID=341454 RepID=A0A4S2MJS7_9PEZI|nr:S-adenosyl-L-methionine-dependent methyltransferase [Ascodesmis nigricans]